MSEHVPYYTLFYVTLEQHTEFNTASGEQGNDVDIALAKDGNDNYIIRGTTLAGAIVVQAKKLGIAVEYDISGEAPAQDKNNKPICIPSRLRVDTASLKSPLHDAIVRQHVAIDEVTGAAKPNALFDVQVLPKGNLWHCFIEVNMIDCTPRSIAPDELVAHVLHYWQTNYLFLGHRPVAGYGWFKVQQAEVVTLTDEHVFDYPNSTCNFTQNKAQLCKQLQVQSTPLDQFVKNKTLADAPVLRKTLLVTLNAGANLDESGEQWGVDGFFIGGHSQDIPESIHELPDSVLSHFSTGSSYKLQDQDTPDNFFVVDENHQPYIPGASIRGVLNHQLVRANESKIAHSLFGSLNKQNGKVQSSNLYIKPAYLQHDDWQAMVFHNHAEDEFTAGVYGSNKFVRTAVVRGSFVTELVLEYIKDPDANNADHMKSEVKAQYDALCNALQQGAQSQLAIGAKQWVDSGWLRWKVQEQKEEGADND